jgi:ATP-dependent RNA helicase DeaD
VDTEVKEPTGVTRGQNAVHVLPSDWSLAERVLASLVDRIDPLRAEIQLLIVTPDAESAANAATSVVQVLGDRPLAVVAATASPRAARLLRAAPAHVVTGAPADLVALLQGSALKPETVRIAVFAWLDPILDTPEAEPLETLLAELPKDAARIVLAGEITPALEALIERYARRARRSADVPIEPEAVPLEAEYVAAAGTARVPTLRRLLDALDLPRAQLYARSGTARAEAIGVARALGYPAAAVRLTGDAEPASSDPLVLVELPESREELRALAGTSGRKIYAVVQPSQVASLRALLGGGTVRPVTLLEAAERARGKDAALRASLRDVLTSGNVHREVLALEPLLAEYDGVAIAAAALHLLEQHRPVRSAATPAPLQPMQRLFVNLGEKDGVRAKEIVAAITTEAGIPGSQVGKVEVRDTHSLVEVAAPVAQLVAEKLTGSMVRGRRVQARLDAPRDERAARGGSAGGRGDRPERTFDRGARGRDDRPRGGGGGGGGPRGAAPRGDRPARPPRPFTGQRKFDRDEGSRRPTRPRPRRDDA